MKKTLLILGLMVGTLTAFADGNTFQFKSLSFINEAAVRSLVVSNLTAAPLGGFTNVLSWGYPGIQTTNPANAYWTNQAGTKVFPTNNVAGTDPAGVHFVFGDTTQLFLDVPLWVNSLGQLPFTPVTNTVSTAIFLDNFAYSPMSVSMSYIGAASVSGTMNVVFVGVPDGTNEPNNAVSLPLWQWGVTTAAGAGVIATNFPIWRFPGCKAVRVRSITGVAAAAASDFTIISLRLNGFVP